jgi:hypothetical protein
MSWEQTLVALIAPLCPRVEPDAAAPGTALPFVTYQAFGGRALRYVDASATDKRHALVQINVWAASRAASAQLLRQIEDALCLHTGWQCQPAGEYRADAEPDIRHYGSSQDFDIVAPR